eukprot:TRINITY_DN3168_c1_g1_i1.p1 TRINITY_DN3168_c1_g1~~TRINITY_DN3168_c1_g1_i1.p1  ORF type:complete len:294 (+),score=100.58 TRINITY_DN3168_c1_g1_i1:48-929(+)
MMKISFPLVSMYHFLRISKQQLSKFSRDYLESMHVGDIFSAYNKEELKKRGMTHIVTVVYGIEPIFPEEFKYCNVAIRDLEGELISSHFDRVFSFIDQGRAEGNVLVHCLRGVSRSATIATAYVMKQNGIPASEALKILKEKRNVINPNAGFMKQLDEFYGTHILSSLPPSNSDHPPLDHNGEPKPEGEDDDGENITPITDQQQQHHHPHHDHEKLHHHHHDHDILHHHDTLQPPSSNIHLSASPSILSSSPSSSAAHPPPTFHLTPSPSILPPSTSSPPPSQYTEKVDSPEI